MSIKRFADRVLIVARDACHLERATTSRRTRNINDFPAEILGEIFKWSFILIGQMQSSGLEEYVVSGNIQAAILAICRVCWRWRRIFSRMSEAWCRFDMSAALVRSSLLGLNFMGTRRPLHIRGYVGTYTVSEAIAVSALLDACRTHTGRIQTIQLCSAREDPTFYLLLLRRLANTVMPNLEQLALSAGATQSQALGIANEAARFICTPSLRSLRLTDIFIDMRRVRILSPLPQLTSFTLHYACLTEPIIAFIFAHLRAVPVLQELVVSSETCTLQGIDPAALPLFARNVLLGSGQYPVTMSSLRKLEFRMLPPELVVVLYQIIRAPALKESVVAFEFAGLEQFWSMDPVPTPLTQCLECECDLALSIQAPSISPDARRREREAAREGDVDWRTKIVLAPLDSGLKKPATCKCTHFVVELGPDPNATPTSGTHEPFFQLLMDYPTLVRRITHVSVSLSAMQTSDDWRRLLTVAPGLLVLQLTDVDASQLSIAALVIVCKESRTLGACYPAMAPLLRCLHVVYASDLPTETAEGKVNAYALTWLVIVVQQLTGISDVLVDGVPSCVRNAYKWQKVYQHALRGSLWGRETGGAFGRCRCGACNAYA
ncbi:hypothetical protein EUX98_g3148 [Antrodiella citrinella]|uniref:F-box domain-containing protein n=1 Tax=Antrodiella citrinella TaxID=2447956 RepID=A0A4S4MZE7_9APHY|nr:hypothetical protein EUX98_g3148 [Antrodiella citrinella]